MLKSCIQQEPCRVVITPNPRTHIPGFRLMMRRARRSTRYIEIHGWSSGAVVEYDDVDVTIRCKGFAHTSFAHKGTESFCFPNFCTQDMDLVPRIITRHLQIGTKSFNRLCSSTARSILRGNTLDTKRLLLAPRIRRSSSYS